VRYFRNKSLLQLVCIKEELVSLASGGLVNKFSGNKFPVESRGPSGGSDARPRKLHEVIQGPQFGVHDECCSTNATSHSSCGAYCGPTWGARLLCLPGVAGGRRSTTPMTAARIGAPRPTSGHGFSRAAPRGGSHLLTAVRQERRHVRAAAGLSARAVCTVRLRRNARSGFACAVACGSKE
jgi:hypothetical protein